MAAMKLYYSDVLSPRKACAAARYLAAPVEYVYLDLTKAEHRTPAMLAINPSGKVPTLVDGDRIVCEADAIICHLSERMGAALWPRECDDQIEVVGWLSWNAMHFGRACGALYFEHIIKPRFGIGPLDPAVESEALAEFRRFAAVLDDRLGGRDWVMGDRLTVADFALAVALPYAGAAHMPLDEFPALRRWHDRLDAFDAWRDPWPAR
ncbi:MAG TPA: glutathione S-transferase family protein [Rhizomicrobium sp.]